MNIPAFTAQASLYRTSNRYHSSVAEFHGSISGQSVVAAYIPGPETQNRCSGCTDICVATRNICLAKVAAGVVEECWGTLGLGCAVAIGWGVIQTGGCYAHYAECFGICQIPSADELGWKSPCCPKVCGIHIPGLAGSGCCDHGEACLGSDHPNTRDGCCPVGQYCNGNCCAAGESCCGATCCPAGFSCIGGLCTTGFPNTPPPPPPDNNCIFGGAPCGLKCCPPGLECCSYSPQFGADCRTSCLH
jgi:hypothetical protein